jgi:DNA recombination protein RmuC
MHALGKDISSLQDILRAPKLRGGLGELLLEDLLSQVLPSANFETQYTFASGEKVDAVIRLGDCLVPVDSKFPLESFTRMQGAETDEERRKCRRVMYIPAENVFYEVIVRDDDAGAGDGISAYALARHVVPVSPNSFYAYLMAIAYGLKGLRIEERAAEIRGQLGEIRQALGRFSEEFQVVGRHLENARGRYGDADRSLARIRETFRLIASEGETRR